MPDKNMTQAIRRQSGDCSGVCEAEGRCQMRSSPGDHLADTLIWNRGVNAACQLRNDCAANVNEPGVSDRRIPKCRKQLTGKASKQINIDRRQAPFGKQAANRCPPGLTLRLYEHESDGAIRPDRVT